MKKLILVLALVGCGSSLPTSDTTSWSVTVGNWETPVCDGRMTLSPAESRDTLITRFAGTWRCGVFTGSAEAQFHGDGRAFLDLESNPGNWNGVRGELAGDAIVGDITFDDRIQPFIGYQD